MKPELEQYVLDIVEQENQKTDNRYDVKSLSVLPRNNKGEQVKDSSALYLVDGINSESDSILTVSNEHFPYSVNDAVGKIDGLIASLEPQLNKHILQPSTSGCYNKQSYAFWPRHKPIANNKILKRIQIMSVHGKVIRWISGIGRESCRPIETQQQLALLYLEPLRFLIAQAYIPVEIKRIAGETLKSIETESFQPFSVIQHGDFWYGNILLDKFWPYSLHSPIPFYVIDWGGANLNGFPFIDLLRYCESIGTDKNRIARDLNTYGNICNLTIEDIVRYACAYSGHLGLNRNEFPLQRYLQLISNLIEMSEYCAKLNSPHTKTV